MKAGPASDLLPYRLRVNHLGGYALVSAEAPEFMWSLRGEWEACGVSTRVVVEQQGEIPQVLWDSGWFSGDVQQIRYAGDPLENGARYAWRVELSNGSGATQCETGAFLTGLGSHIGGGWITRDPNHKRDLDPPELGGLSWRAGLLPPTSLLRREFHIPVRPVFAVLFASARGIYVPHLNGGVAGSNELAPGWVDYRSHEPYHAIDVTDMLHAGSNVLAAELAEGWWSGYVGFDPKEPANHYGRVPQLWMQLRCFLPDGSYVDVVTDEEWRAAEGATRFADLLIGQYIDQRREPTGWTRPDFDDSAWHKVRVFDSDLSRLVPAEAPGATVTHTLPVVAVHETPNGQIFDFGQNIVGRVVLGIGDANVGSALRFRYGEALDGEDLYVANLRNAEATDYFIGTSESQVFRPLLTLHGFRYVEVSGARTPLLQGAIQAEVISADVEWIGSLQTSHPQINRLVENIRWSQRGNMVVIPTDCPQRDERLGWLADAQVFLPTAAYNADVYAFMRQWMQDVRVAQSAEGSFADVAPLISSFFGDGAPGWGDAGVLIPWELYRRYGDLSILRVSLDSMIRWVDFVADSNPDLIWRCRVGHNYGDWLELGEVKTPRELFATAYFARSAFLTARAAHALGSDETARLRSLARSVRRAFIKAFLRDDGTIAGGTQTAYALAIGFDLVPAGLRERTSAALARAVGTEHPVSSTGIIGTSMLLPALTKAGYPHLAFELLERRDYPSWLFSVEHGASTTWERWDGWTEERGFQNPDMNSLNHYALGAVGEWIWEVIGGIAQRENSIGYRHLRISPIPGGTITSAAAAYETPLGRVESSWTLDGNEFRLEVLVPPGACADIDLPFCTREDRALTGASSFRPVRAATIAAGRHSFVSDTGQWPNV